MHYTNEHAGVIYSFGGMIISSLLATLEERVYIAYSIVNVSLWDFNYF